MLTAPGSGPPLSPPLPPSVDPNDQKKTACYDIDVEVEDPLKSQMSSFLLSTANQQEIASLDNKVSQRHAPPLRPGHAPSCATGHTHT